MATSAPVVQDMIDKMRPLDVSARAMFGEYGLYFEGKNFAFVCDNTLFIKVTDEGKQVAGRIGLGAPYPGAKPAFKISRAKLNDPTWLRELITVTSRALPAPRPKKKTTSR